MANVSKRDSLKTLIVKCAKHFNGLDVEKETVTSLKIRQRSLEEYWTRFQDIHQLVMEVTGKHEFDNQMTVFTAVEAVYYQAAIRVDEFIHQLSTKPQQKKAEKERINVLRDLIADIHVYVQNNGAMADEGTLHSHSNDLQRLYQQFEQLIFETVDNGDAAALEALAPVQEQYRSTVALLYTHTARFRNALPAAVPAVIDGCRNIGQVDNNSRLPRLEPPSFDGSVLSWESFRDLYISIIHERQDLSDVRKFQYLKCCMKGSAEPLLRNFTLTNANYAAAWQLLLDRFNNRKVLVNEHLRQLMSQPNCKENAADLKCLLNKTSESLRALENLDRPVRHWDDWVVYIVSQRLDSESRKLWEQSQCAGDQYPTWEQLGIFIQGRIRALEAISQLSNKSSAGTPQRQQHSLKSHQVTTDSNKCALCQKPHRLMFCGAFKRKSTAEKRTFIQRHQLCFNCFRSNHTAEECSSTNTCFKCGKRHHTTLHYDEQAGGQLNSNNTPVEKKSVVTPTTSSNQSAGTSSLFTTSSQATLVPSSLIIADKNPSASFTTKSSASQVLLATALVDIIQPSGEPVTVRALLDQGSQSSFITEAAVQKLGLHKQSVNVSVSGIGSTPAGAIKSCVSFNCKPHFKSNHLPPLFVDALVLRKITSISPISTTCIANWGHINGLQLADPNYQQQDKIDLLLGAEVYSRILLNDVRLGPPGSPTAQLTLFGWILSGQLYSTVIKSQSATTFSHHCGTSLDDTIKRFWEIEQVPDQHRHLTLEEKSCEAHFASTYRRGIDGRFIVYLPKINGTVSLGHSEHGAVSRQLQMERRFAKTPTFFAKYAEFLHEYELLDHMELIVNPKPVCNNVYYIPHHAVVKDSSSTTKIRVVFDASRKSSNGLCLNEQLYTGPRLQQDLTSIIMRWRKYKIAFTSDIEKMYRQIHISTTDRDLQRIVWRQSSDHQLQHYRLKTVTYGISAAPYLAIKSLQQLAIDEQHIHPIGSIITLRDFYVDDVLSGCDSIVEALEAQRQLIALLGSAKFVLKKWASNRSELLEHLPPGHVECKVPLEMNLEGVKTLGLYWNPAQDEFAFKIHLGPKSSEPTKRTILSDVARLYDPLGWLAPCVVLAKIMMQNLWRHELKWDDTLPALLAAEWSAFRAVLHALECIRIPRWINCNANQLNVQIHGFCDASMVAYAAAVYVRVVNVDGSINVNLLTAKSKVAPLKTISVPRLELCGAVLLAQLLESVVGAMELRITSLHAWTDSTIVLAWLAGNPTRWNVFVANRVTTITQILPFNRWRHVVSEHNPADCASRGLQPPDLISHTLWWHGPQWLQLPAEQWPSIISIHDTTEDERKSSLVGETKSTTWSLIESYSSLSKLLRVTAFITRFLSNIRLLGGHRVTGPLRPTDLMTARDFWIRVTQEAYFRDDMESLRAHQLCNRHSSLVRLTPFIDENEILRVGGRLRRSIIPYNERHPIIIPKTSPLTELLISEAHLLNLHSGVQATLGYLRRTFWMIDGRNRVRMHIHRCVRCFRQRAPTQTQIMSDLPAARIVPTLPFRHTAIDCSGFIRVRSSKGRGHHSTKAYIALFVCMVTKAIHLEVVSDLTSAAFIAAFRRFTGRRGICSDVYSDNGTNFVGANTELQLQRCAGTRSQSKDIADSMAKDGTTWHFSPPLSPHFNGLAEAGIKSTKNLLQKIIGESTPTFEELSTLLVQVEACLNSRPLYPLTTDPHDFSPLTPGHFLTGGPLNTVPEPSVLDVNINRLSRWQAVQRMYQHFWQRWSREYFHYLFQRTKWTTVQPDLQVGNMVLVKEDNVPPAKWPLGRIISVKVGPDGHVRVARIRLGGTVMDRPIVKLALLPISDNELSVQQPEVLVLND